MIDVNTFVYSKLTEDSALAALVGQNIFDIRPEVVTEFPSVIYSESNQIDVEFVDELPDASNSTVAVDVYVKQTSPSEPSLTAVAIAVCNVFKGLFWSCIFNQEIPDPAPDVRHRHLEFTRPLMASDVLT